MESRQSAATLKRRFGENFRSVALFQSFFFSKKASFVALKQDGSNDGIFEA